MKGMKGTERLRRPIVPGRPRPLSAPGGWPMMAAMLRINRRDFLASTAVSLIAAPLVAQAQRAAGKVYRMGILSPGGVSAPSVPTLTNLLPSVLREHGYVEGQNLVVDRRFADDRRDRLPGLARELAQVRPDVIVALSGQAAHAARNATATIPILMPFAADPVAWGLVASLSRPGGNVTGITSGHETLAGKCLELLKEAVPRAVRIAVLGSAPLSSSAQLREAQKAAE